MKRELKYVLYFIAFIAILSGLFKFFNVSLFSNSALNSASALEWQKQVNVYFGNSTMGSNADCSKVFPVARTILNAETFGPGALEALLNGVVEGEKTKGYFTSINDGVLIKKFEIKDQMAYVDFSSRFNEGVAGSCTVTAIRAQIETTLNSLPDIDAVVMSVNGQTEGILEP